MPLNILLVLTLTIAGNCEAYRRINQQCNTDHLLTVNDGVIKSHTLFGRGAYGSNWECYYVIKAPVPSYKIELSSSHFDLEYTKDCTADAVTVYSGGNRNTALGHYCGGKHWSLVIDSNLVTIKFTTDTYLNKGGFLLRYKFLTADQRNKRVICPINFLSCGGYSNKCYYKDWKCDNIRDCPNNGDEINCGGGGGGSIICSVPFMRPCANNEKCIYNSWWCDNIRDCSDNSDENNCSGGGVTTTTVPPITTTKPQTVTTTAPVIPPSSCGNTPIPPDETRIVGGKEAIPNSWPWMCSLRYFGGHFCGGSIYNNRWIVSAAHCADGRTNPSSWSIDCGRHNRDGSQSTVQSKNVIRVMIHPNYNNALTDKDIALFKLGSDLVFNNFVQPVCFPTTPPSSGTFCFATGWGNTQNTGDSSVLRQVAVPIISNAVCGDSQHYGGGITNNMICAGYEQGGKDACQGDSGGPLVCRTSATSPWYLHGITSFGEGCAKAKRPGVYTRVTQFTSWIQQQVAGN